VDCDDVLNSCTEKLNVREGTYNRAGRFCEMMVHGDLITKKKFKYCWRIKLEMPFGIEGIKKHLN